MRPMSRSDEPHCMPNRGLRSHLLVRRGQRALLRAAPWPSVAGRDVVRIRNGDLRHVERDVLRLSATLDRDLYAVGRDDRVEDLDAALRIVERRAVDRQDEVARLQAQPCELLAITPRVDATAALHAAREHRLRAHAL